MNQMLRKALRENLGLRHQLETNLLGEKGEIWEKEFKKFLRQEPCWIKEGKKKITEVLKTLRVDFSLSLLEMIKLGQYGWINSDINPQNFLLIGKGVEEVEYKLFHFGKDMSTAEVETKMKEEGYESAKIHHLLSFGAQNPEEQKSHPIIGLGSSAKFLGNWCVPCLDFGDGERRLSLYYRGYDWFGHCRFLAVRKPQH